MTWNEACIGGIELCSIERNVAGQLQHPSVRCLERYIAHYVAQ